jgi:hypothetical protein
MAFGIAASRPKGKGKFSLSGLRIQIRVGLLDAPKGRARWKSSGFWTGPHHRLLGSGTAMNSANKMSLLVNQQQQLA